MSVTEEFTLPEISELTVQEINLSYPVLQAASFYVGKYCEWYNNEFMLCRTEERDPRRCLNEGKNVTSCALEFFRKLKKNCRPEFEKYAHCIEMSSAKMEFYPCRQTQAVLDKCMLEKLQIERPKFGYFCETKVHDTTRPEPPPRHEYKEQKVIPKLDTETIPLPLSKHGSHELGTR